MNVFFSPHRQLTLQLYFDFSLSLSLALLMYWPPFTRNAFSIQMLHTKLTSVNTTDKGTSRFSANLVHKHFSEKVIFLSVYACQAEGLRKWDILMESPPPLKTLETKPVTKRLIVYFIHPVVHSSLARFTYYRPSSLTSFFPKVILNMWHKIKYQGGKFYSTFFTIYSKTPR